MDDQPRLAGLLEAARDEPDVAEALDRVRQRMFGTDAQRTRSDVLGGSPASGSPQVGRYLIVETLGAGGMGVVVRAYDPSLNREVALKRVHDGKHSRGRARLLREAQAMARLHHPNVVSVFDVQARDDDVVIAMEFVAGGDLSSWLEGERSVDAILARFIEAGQGLAAAHAAGLVHRDFKPANVLLDGDGTAKVGDFGLAKGDDAEVPEDARVDVRRTDGLQTAAGVVMGTPRYMAPEQADGRGADARSDQYAFCVALWEALCGEPPFDGDDTAALQWSKLKGAPRWSGPRGVSRTQIAALERGLRSDRDRRFVDMHALLDALRPRGVGRAVGATVGVGMLAAAIGYAAWPGDDPCAQERAGMTARWTAARAEVLERLRGVGAGYGPKLTDAAAHKLDGFVRDWSSMHEAACQAEGNGDMESQAVLACLAVRRARGWAAVDGLRGLDDATAEKGFGLLARIRSPEDCADASLREAEGLVETTPEAREHRVRFEGTLAQARVAAYLGAFERAEALQHDAAALVEGDPRLILRVREAELSAIVVGGDLPRAVELGAQLYDDALRARAYDVAVRVGSRAAVLLSHSDEPERALEVARTTRALAEGQGLPLSIRAAALGNLGSVLVRAGQLGPGVEALKRSNQLRVDAGQTNNFDHAQGLKSLARAYFAQGKHDEVTQVVREAYALVEETFGPSHPWTHAIKADCALMLSYAGEQAEAEAVLRAALANAEETFGPASRRVLPIRDNLATALVRAGRLEDAREINARSLELKRDLFGDGHPQTRLTRENLAIVRLRQGAAEDAVALLDRDSTNPLTLLTLGRAHAALGRDEDARACFDDGLRVAEATLGEVADLRVGLGVARARVDVRQGRRTEAVRRMSGLWTLVTDTPASAELQAQVARVYVEALGPGLRADAVAAEGRRACVQLEPPNEDCAALVGDTPAVIVGDDAR